MEAYIESVVKPLLSKPESFRVVKTTDEMGVLLTVDVALEDISHLIGKSGQHISSIRKILSLYGLRHNAKISLKVNEPIGGKKHHAS